MFAIRFALFLGLFYGFTVIAYDPHISGARLTTRATSDQGSSTDPDGLTATPTCTCDAPDAGPRIDPEG